MLIRIHGSFGLVRGLVRQERETEDAFTPVGVVTWQGHV